MKKITSKLVAVLMIVVMAFGISGTATVKTEAKESKGYVIKVNLGTNCTTVYKNGKAIKAMICSVGQMMVHHLGCLTLVLSILGDHFLEMYMVSMPQE